MRSIGLHLGRSNWFVCSLYKNPREDPLRFGLIFYTTDFSDSESTESALFRIHIFILERGTYKPL